MRETVSCCLSMSYKGFDTAVFEASNDGFMKIAADFATFAFTASLTISDAANAESDTDCWSLFFAGLESAMVPSQNRILAWMRGSTFTEKFGFFGT